MKTLAFLVALVLQATGLWPHVSQHARAGLSRAAAPAPAVLEPATSSSDGRWPVKLGQEPLSFAGDESVYALDTTTGLPLYASNADRARPIASITKLMTVLVVLERHGLDEPLTVPELPAYGPDDERLGLTAGEHTTVRALVQAALIASDNDAADALARWDAGSEAAFTARMNAKAAEWGLADLHFASATGLTDAGTSATATSLARLAPLALRQPFLRTTVGETEATITTDRHVYTLRTTDQLLAAGTFYGIKTGYTPQAGECFLGLTRVDGHEVVTVVLGAGDRFGDTQTLTNWIGRTYQWL